MPCTCEDLLVSLPFSCIDRKPSSSAEAIPEGFFDDPVMDAKVHQTLAFNLSIVCLFVDLFV